MIKQLPITFLVLIATLTSKAQEKRKLLYASIKDDIGVVANAHVINKNTKQGTFSNEEGKFRVLAKPNDILQISFVGYETKTIKVTATHFGIKDFIISFKKVPIELDEVEVKKHYLTGFLSTDIKQTPKDTVGNLVNNLVSGIKKMKYNDIVNMPIGKDEIHLVKVAAPSIGPGYSNASIASVSLGNKALEKERQLKKELQLKEELPNAILSDFGKHFFFVELKIPEENYLHFLEYCNPLGIDKMYANNEILKLIDLFREESKKYLEIINKKE